MYDDYFSQPYLRAGWIGDTLEAVVDTMSTCDDISTEIANKLIGMIYLARGDAMRLSNELDPVFVTIERRGPQVTPALSTAAEA